jgi:hypothetical protein
VKLSHRPKIVFDDTNLIAHAGLAPAMALADRAGLGDALGDLTIDNPNAGAKAACLIAGLLAGADSIDDMDVLRTGGLPRLFDGVYARPPWARSSARPPSGTPARSRRPAT